MKTSQPVIFDNWQKGMGKHPLYGHELLQNIDAFENKGIAKLKTALIPSETIGTLTDSEIPLATATHSSGDIYMASSTTVYKISGGVSTTVQTYTNVKDIKIFKDYLWISYGQSLDYYGPLSGTPSGTTSVTSSLLSSSTTELPLQIIAGVDDYLYVSNGNYVAKFDVTINSTTGLISSISTTLNALDLPDGYNIMTMCEYGTNIALGCSKGNSKGDFINNFSGRVYFWDRRALTLGDPGKASLPVIFNENGIWQMITHAGRLFVVAGTQGNVYETNSTSYAKITTLPCMRSGLTDRSYVTYYPNAIAISERGTLLIGVSGTGDNTKAGVYEIDIHDSSYPCQMQNLSLFNLSGYIIIGYISLDSGRTLRVGWYDGNDAGEGQVYGSGVDETDTFRTVIRAVVKTDMRRVGTFYNKRTFEQVEIVLTDPLTTSGVGGSEIIVSYRSDNFSTDDSNFTELFTWTLLEGGTGTTNASTGLSCNQHISIPDCEFIQLKLDIYSDEGALVNTNINLISVTLI